MAVPKKKTSKSRRDKRRAQHRIEAPRVNLCPTCHQPKRPHRICPNCKTYNGREVEPLRRDKRRAQHRIEAPRVNLCPTCHQPKRPHRICPNCKTYNGREVEPLRAPAP